MGITWYIKKYVCEPTSVNTMWDIMLNNDSFYTGYNNDVRILFFLHHQFFQ